MPSWTESGQRRLPRELTVVAALLAASLVAWAITYRRMRGSGFWVAASPSSFPGLTIPG